MFTSGTQIQIRESGTTILVDELEISDLVYDPLKRNYQEIVDILKRTIKIATNGYHPLRPIQVRAGSAGAGQPSRDLVISPSQCVLDVFGDQSGHRAIEFILASSLVQRGQAKTLIDLQEVTYFAIFTHNKSIISTEGMLALTYSPAVLESEEGEVLETSPFPKISRAS